MQKPYLVAGLLLLAGSGLAVGGVFVLTGPGWALLTAALPCLLLGAIVVRGMRG